MAAVAISVMQCPLCKNYNTQPTGDPGRNVARYECVNCGRFTITNPAISASGKDAWKLSSYVREMNGRGITPTFYASQSSLGPDAEPGSVGVDTVIDAFPKEVAERLDRALINLASATEHLGQRILIRSEGGDALLLAKNSSEVFFTIQHFEQEGYIRGKTTSLPTEICLTGRGLSRVSDLQRGLLGATNKQAFVAMSFDKTLYAAYTHGLRMGIEASGHKPMRIDGKEHNSKICDVIVAEIRNSKFLVADFTLHRGGVYFEAGLMMGLGRPVIFTCRQDHIKDAHFDTRQYNHIVWDTPADLCEKLKRRIQATIAM